MQNKLEGKKEVSLFVRLRGIRRRQYRFSDVGVKQNDFRDRRASSRKLYGGLRKTDEREGKVTLCQSVKIDTK